MESCKKKINFSSSPTSSPISSDKVIYNSINHCNITAIPVMTKSLQFQLFSNDQIPSSLTICPVQSPKTICDMNHSNDVEEKDYKSEMMVSSIVKYSCINCSVDDVDDAADDDDDDYHDKICLNKYIVLFVIYNDIHCR